MAAERRVRPLRAAPQKQPSMSIVLAADQGTYRDLLVALRSRIAKAVQDDDTPAREVAALTLRLLDIVKEIAELDAAKGVDDVGAAAGTPDEEWAAP
jgi:hypothetical protein